MWFFLVRSEHVKGKEAVSEEIGNFTTDTSGSAGGEKKKPEYAKLGVRVSKVSSKAKPGDGLMFIHRRNLERK